MTTLAILAFCLLFLFIILMVTNRYRIRDNRQKQVEGIQYLQKLASLLFKLQQHRGISIAVLAGDNSLKAQINQLQQQIYLLSELDSNQSHWIEHNELWASIWDHWQRLKQNYINLSKESNFLQHNSLIKTALFLIEDCAESHHLQELQCSNNQSANFLWQSLLTGCEHIGQARAIGTGIAASGSSTSVERIKLNFLKGQLEDFMNANPLTELNADIAHFTNAIEAHILVDKPDLTAEQYFNLATAVLNKIQLKFEFFLAELKQQQA